MFVCVDAFHVNLRVLGDLQHESSIAAFRSPHIDTRILASSPGVGRARPCAHIITRGPPDNTSAIQPHRYRAPILKKQSKPDYPSELSWEDVREELSDLAESTRPRAPCERCLDHVSKSRLLDIIHSSVIRWADSFLSHRQVGLASTQEYLNSAFTSASCPPAFNTCTLSTHL